LEAAILDQFLEEFAPPAGSSTRGQESLLGRPGLEVNKFYVAWNSAQLEGIIGKSQEADGAYVAYLGEFDEKTRCLLSLALRGFENLVIRVVGLSWRYHSWGVTARIARDIGLTDARPVAVSGRESRFKIVTFAPQDALTKVRESLFSAGGGRYGLYSRCSFSSPGKGTFYGEKGAEPARGRAGRLEEVEEERLEVVITSDRLGSAMSALRKAHPYEEPVIEVYEVGYGNEFGEGRVGRLESTVTAGEASRKIASILGSQPVYVSGVADAQEMIVWDGNPGRGLYEALLRGVDLYVGPDSHGLAKILAGTREAGIVEFPRYCFLMSGAKELIYLIREKSKREGWGLRTFLPSKVGKEGVHT
jgi:hypothetical protein